VNWDGIKTALAQVVADIDGIDDDAAVKWRDDAASAHYRKFPRVDLSINSIIGYGDDENRIEVNELDERIEWVSGPRRFTWTISVESSQGLYSEALNVMGRIRANLRRASVTEHLGQFDIAIASFEAQQTVSYKADGRPYSVVTMDVFVNAAENIQDESEYAGETIEQVSAASEYIKDPDGENNPNQVQLEVSESGW
jgi:hypothetical protein